MPARERRSTQRLSTGGNVGKLRRELGKNKIMVLEVGVKFPRVTLQDIDGKSVEFPQVLTDAPATVVFFYRGQW